MGEAPPPPPPAEAPPKQKDGKQGGKKKGKDQMPPAEGCPEGTMLMDDGTCVPIQ